MKKILLGMSLVLLSQHSIADVLPLGLRLEGAGGVAGAVYKQGGPGKGKQLLAGVVAGDFIGAGGLYTKYVSPKFEKSFALGIVRDLEFETTYLRGLQDDESRTYTQNLNVLVGAFGTKYWIEKDKFVFNTSVTLSNVELVSFEDDDGEVKLPGAKLFNVTTINAKAGVEYFNLNSSKTKGIKLGADATVLTGRKGQSDHLLLGGSFKGIYPLMDSLNFSFNSRISQASIITERYKTKEKIKEAFEVNCSSISDSKDRSRCETLESDLVNFVFDHNTKGTTSPFGGSGSPRSFRELRFKSSNQALYSVELGWDIVKAFNISKLEGKRIEFVLFHDVAYGSDATSQLFKESVYSNGGGINLGVKEFDIKLQAATGSFDSSAWFLSLGKRI